MRKTTLSIIHVILVAITLISVIRGNQLPELIPYQIVPLDHIQEDSIRNF
mgnify:CR=1 FL=1